MQFKKYVSSVLTFNEIPNSFQLEARAEILAYITKENGFESAMIGGAPYFMSYLEKALLENGIQPLYAFSVRESVEEIQNDGSVIKKNVFRHLGFVKGGK